MKHYCPYNTGLPAFITHYVQGHTYYEKGCGDNKLDILFKGLIQDVYSVCSTSNRNILESSVQMADSIVWNVMMCMYVPARILCLNIPANTCMHALFYFSVLY